MLGPQAVALFGEVMEPFGGGALVEEVCHGKPTLGVYSLTSLPGLSLCFWRMDEM